MTGQGGFHGGRVIAVADDFVYGLVDLGLGAVVKRVDGVAGRGERLGDAAANEIAAAENKYVVLIHGEVLRLGM